MSGSNPGWIKGFVPSAAQWAAEWSLKMDVTGDASQTTVLPTNGGTVANTLAQRFSATLNVADFGMLPGNTATANAVAFQATLNKMVANGGAVIVIPPGEYQIDVTSAPLVIANSNTSPFIICGYGVILFPTGNSGLFSIKPANAGTYPYGGYGRIEGLTVYTATNPTAGAYILLDNCDGVRLQDLILSGGFINIDIASSIHTYATNIEMSGGNNTTAGSTIIRVRQSTTAGYNNINCSENFLTGINGRSNTQGSYTNALVINNSDGMQIANAHFGFTSGDAILIQPGTSNGFIAGLNFVNVGSDHAGTGTSNDSHGWNLKPYNGTFTGFNGYHTFSNCAAGISNGNGFYATDPALLACTLNNFSTNYSGSLAATAGDGINIQAGSGWSITGGGHYSNNVSQSHGYHIRIGGTTNGLVLTGPSFSEGSYAVDYDIGIQGSANNIVIGHRLHSGASDGPFTLTSSGTSIFISPMLNGATGSGSSAGSIATPTGIDVVVLSSSAGTPAGANYLQIQGNGSGGGVSVYPAGVDGNNNKLTLYGGATSAGALVFAASTAQFNAEVGFNGNTPSGKINVTGSRGSATAAVLEAFLQAMQSFGLITDSTTA